MFQVLALVLLQVGNTALIQGDAHRFSPGDNSFTVTFPGEPGATETQTFTGTRLVTTRIAYFDDGSRNSFHVSWTEYEQGLRPPRGSDSLVVRMLKAFAGTKRAETIDQGALTADDPHARPAMLRTPEGRTILVRFSILGNRVYQLMAEVDGGDPSLRRARDFLSSFQQRP